MPRLLSLIFFILLAVFAVSAQDETVLPETTPVPSKSILRGRVYYESSGRPVRRMSVSLINVQTPASEYSGLTDANGYLEIKHVKAGKYVAIVNAPGAISPLSFLDFRDESYRAMESASLGFPEIAVDGMSVIETDIPVKTGGSITGRVTYADGSPAIGVGVQILRKVGDEYLPTLPNMSVLAARNSGSGMFQTDDRGVYRFPGLPTGEYIVRAIETANHSTTRSQTYNPDRILFGGGSLLEVFFENAFVKEDAQVLTLSIGQELSEINITIPERALFLLEGRLVAARDKLPIRNATLTFSRAESTEFGPYHPMNESQSTTSDNEGRWIFKELPRGKYKITVTVQNSSFDTVSKSYGPVVDINGYTPANAAANAYSGPTKTPPQPKFSTKSVEFTVEEADLTEQTIELDFGSRVIGTVAAEGGKSLPDSLSLRLTDESGRTLADTYVSAYNYGPSGRTDSSSKEFEIDAVPSGNLYFNVGSVDEDYYLKSATAGGTDLVSTPLNLKSLSTIANVKVVLGNDAGSLECRVEDSEGRTLPGIDVLFVPTDQTRLRNLSYHKYARSNTNGSISLKLPPFEYAAILLPAKLNASQQRSLRTWIAEAVKGATKFSIEPRKAATGKIVFAAR